MKLIGIYVFRGEDPICIARTLDLEDVWLYKRDRVQDFIDGEVYGVVIQVPGGNRAVAELGNGMGRCFCRSAGEVKLGAVVDSEYPESSILVMLAQLGLEVEKQDAEDAQATVQEFMIRWKDPREADKLLKVERELHEATDTIRGNMRSLLDRGEKLDDLAVKAVGLGVSSVSYYGQAKKNNAKCCWIQ